MVVDAIEYQIVVADVVARKEKSVDVPRLVT